LSTRELSVLQPAQITRSREWHDAARRARWLSWLSLAWMGAEGVIALTAGILAGSIALVSFGLDSFIEGFASLVIVWRFTGSRLLSHAAEERAQKLVAVQFFLLAPYVAFEAVHKLLTGEQPETSWLGIALVTSSVIGMPFLGIAKRRLADKLGSDATRVRGRRICSAPIWPPRSSSACSATRSSGSGGSIPSPRLSSPRSRSRKGARAGAARAAAPTARDVASRRRAHRPGGASVARTLDRAVV
jgi:hypothetical protein